MHVLAQSICLGECVVDHGQIIKEKTSVHHLYLQSVVNQNLVCNLKSLVTLVVCNDKLCQEDY